MPPLQDVKIQLEESSLALEKKSQRKDHCPGSDLSPGLFKLRKYVPHTRLLATDHCLALAGVSAEKGVFQKQALAWRPTWGPLVSDHRREAAGLEESPLTLSATLAPVGMGSETPVLTRKPVPETHRKGGEGRGEGSEGPRTEASTGWGLAREPPRGALHTRGGPSPAGLATERVPPLLDQPACASRTSSGGAGRELTPCARGRRTRCCAVPRPSSPGFSRPGRR